MELKVLRCLKLKMPRPVNSLLDHFTLLSLAFKRNTVPTVVCRGGTVMLSGCFVDSNTGTLHKSDGIMDYLKIQH